MGEQYAEINGIKLSYEIKGEGHPLVLVHGFSMYKEFWIAQIETLSNKFKVITLDNRGCGSSTHSKEPFDMGTLADDLKGLLNHLNIEKTHLAGHSLGGMYAQHFALKYPDNLEKLILLATFSNLPLDQSGLEMYKKSQLNSYESKVKNPSKAFYNKMKQRFSRNFYKEMLNNPKKKFHNSFSTEDLMKLETIKGTSKPQDILNQIHAIAEHNTLEQISKIEHETLILAAEKDRITSKIASEEMHRKMPNSDLKIFKGGHFFPLEKAPEVNQTILNFLSK